MHVDTVPEVSPLGNRVHPLGKVGKIRIDPIASNTRLFEAGALQLGLESRELNEDVIIESFKNDPEALAAARIYNNDDLPTDLGVSLHVFDATSGAEILRFDMFEDGPHYHYMLRDKSFHVYITYDTAANGDMLEWASRALRSRYELLLRNAGWEELVDQVDTGLLSTALNEVEKVADSLSAPIAGRS